MLEIKDTRQIEKNVIKLIMSLVARKHKTSHTKPIVKSQSH